MTRTRTSPEQKWLINERAVLAGELQDLEAEEARLAARKAYLQRMLDALDSAHAQLVPEAPVMPVHIVRAHARYGGRGNCIQWARDTLRAAYPLAVDTAALTRAAEQVFGLDLSAAEHRSRFRRNSLRAALRKLLALGEAERLHSPAGGGIPDLAGQWRWVPPTAVFADIVAEAQALEAD